MKFASFAKIKLMRLIKATLHNRCRGIPPNFHCITTNFTSFVQLGLFELEKLVESIFLKKKYLLCIFLKYISLNIRREYRADFEVILSSNANIFAPNPVPCTRFQQIHSTSSSHLPLFHSSWHHPFLSRNNPVAFMVTSLANSRQELLFQALC